MAKKMTENERRLMKEINRLVSENLRLRGEISSLEVDLFILREQIKNDTPVNRQIREITAEESLKAVARVLRDYGVID